MVARCGHHAWRGFHGADFSGICPIRYGFFRAEHRIRAAAGAVPDLSEQ